MARRVEVTRSKGNVLRSVVDQNDGWVRLFSPAQRRKVYQDTFKQALILWRQEFLWKRVNKTAVKSSPFNYRRGGNTPMIGPNVGSRKLVNVVGGGSVTVRVPTAAKETDPLKITGTMAFPFGHPVVPEIVAVFQTIPPDEMKWIAQKWGELLLQARDQAVSIERGVRAGQLKLSPEQMASMRRGGRGSGAVGGRSLRR